MTDRTHRLSDLRESLSRKTQWLFELSRAGGGASGRIPTEKAQELREKYAANPEPKDD